MNLFAKANFYAALFLFLLALLIAIGKGPVVLSVVLFVLSALNAYCGWEYLRGKS